MSLTTRQGRTLHSISLGIMHVRPAYEGGEKVDPDYRDLAEDCRALAERKPPFVAVSAAGCYEITAVGSRWLERAAYDEHAKHAADAAIAKVAKALDALAKEWSKRHRAAINAGDDAHAEISGIRQGIRLATEAASKAARS